MEANQINESAMEPSQISNTSVQTPPATNQKAKMPKSSIIGMTILTIIALAGVAFGIWGIAEKDKAEQDLKELSVKITETTGKVTEITTDEITSVDKDGTVTEITDTNVTTGTVNPEDYIYIGEWGLKIKKPKELEKVSYKIQQYANGGNTGAVLMATGVLSGVDGVPDYADFHSCPSGLGAISVRSTSEVPDNEVVNAVKVFSDYGNDYWWSGPQTYCRQETSEAEQNTSRVIQEMLTNKENYSRI